MGVQMGKPVIVASQLLNSMMDVPVPTRAEVADCADAVRQSADALMLSAETAMGEHPIKCVQVLRGVRLSPLCAGHSPHCVLYVAGGLRLRRRMRFAPMRLGG